jgi:hypothetical protein
LFVEFPGVAAPVPAGALNQHISDTIRPRTASGVRRTDADVHRGDAGWTKTLRNFHWIGLEPHSISAGTVRADVVEIRLRVHPCRSSHRWYWKPSTWLGRISR